MTGVAEASALVAGLDRVLADGFARLGPAQATVATAHAIARVVYRMLKYQVEYETISVEEYEKKYEEQQVKYLKKKAAKLGYQLTQLVPA